MPTRALYRGWLGRMEFLTIALRPLEQTKADYNTLENMTAYYDVSKGVLLNAGVAILNPNYNPELPYSQDIMITHHP